jgi:hypothetical protein
MPTELNLCLLCNDHENQSYSVGPKDAEIVVVTNRKNSSNFHAGLSNQLKELGLDTSKVYFTPVLKCP